MRASEWRFLAREGEASYIAAISSNPEAGMVLANAFALIKFQVRAGLSAPLPQPLAENYVEFTRMVLDVEGNRGSGINPRIAKAAVEHWNQIQDPVQKKEFAEQDWVEILAWLRDTRPPIDRNQWRAGWPAIWRRYQDWVRLNREQHQWESSVKQMTVKGLLVNPLTNSYEVALEGIRMRHCVSSYAEDCRNGSYRLFSVVNERTRKNLATVGLRKEGKIWKFSQARGKLNREVDKEVVGLGRVLAKLYCRTQA